MNNIPFHINSIVQGDCIEHLKKLPENSIDLILQTRHIAVFTLLIQRMKRIEIGFSLFCF